MTDTDRIITALYRGLLQREPEQGAAAHWRPVIETNGLEAALSSFLRSAEFASKISQFVNMYPFDQAPAQNIDAAADEDTMVRLWNRIAQAWTKLGLEDPYYSVLTDPRWRGHAEADLIEDFYSTGAGDLQRLESWLARNRVYVNWDGLCAEYGCGVGRFTEWLAKKFNSVLALDVSASHLDLATRRAEGKQILKRVKYVRVTGPADLAMLTGIDLFYSVIVLQHNPPPIILAILAAAFSGLNDGGIAFFQVPTRGHEGYNFNVQEYLERNESHGIEMHAVDQSAIFSLAHRYGLRALEVSRDHCTGPLGISTTFLMRKVDKA